MGLHTLTITTRNDDHKASHLGWLTWILIFPLSVKCQRLSVVVARGKIGEHSSQDQLNPCLLINDFITPHEILNLRGQKCCKINVCQIGSGNEKGDNNGKHSCQCVFFHSFARTLYKGYQSTQPFLCQASCGSRTNSW